MPIELKNVSYRYRSLVPNSQLAIDNVSLTISEGSFVGIAGVTGSGKSTLLEIMAGLATPISGEVSVDGANIKDSPKAKKKVSMVFQYPEYQLFEETVADDIAFGPRNLGLPEDEVWNRVRFAMDLAGLAFDEYKDRSPFHLSGGEKRRVGIAGILAMKPKYLILDEPTAGLDPKRRKGILDAVRKLHRENNVTVILVTHSMEDIALYADKVLFLAKGRIVTEGTPQEVFLNEAALKSASLSPPLPVALWKRIRCQGDTSEETPLSAESLARKIFSLLQKNGASPPFHAPKERRSISC